MLFIMNFVGIGCSLIWPLCFCYYANLATDRALRNGDIVYDLNWFDHPAEIQKYVILMIARSHERIEFTGLGLVSCTLEGFRKVSTRHQSIMHYSLESVCKTLFYLQLVKSSCSFYMVFRSISQQ